MPVRWCIACGVKMVAEYDKDFDVLIWRCPDCGKTHIEGASDD